MTTNYHTPIVAYSQIVVASINDALGSLDAQLTAITTVNVLTMPGTYQFVALTYDSDNVITTGSVVWIDGATGTFTTVTKNTTWFAIDGYTVTHVLGGVTQTVTQPDVTRDAFGRVTVWPVLVVT